VFRPDGISTREYQDFEFTKSFATRTADHIALASAPPKQEPKYPDEVRVSQGLRIDSVCHDRLGFDGLPLVDR